mmetsp:Transcript_113230/g.156403  ORF Transcript_113230/g.156403 Transcript_113230/m.156403 type:complete len:312 (+) Transcript_113230:239-1174(+)
MTTSLPKSASRSGAATRRSLAAPARVSAAPGLLGHGPPRHPVREPSVAIVGRRSRLAATSRGAAPASVSAAPGLLRGGPASLPVGKAGIAVVGHSQHRGRRRASVVVQPAAPLPLRRVPGVHTTHLALIRRGSRHRRRSWHRDRNRHWRRPGDHRGRGRCRRHHRGRGRCRRQHRGRGRGRGGCVSRHHEEVDERQERQEASDAQAAAAELPAVVGRHLLLVKATAALPDEVVRLHLVVPTLAVANLHPVHAGDAALRLAAHHLCTTTSTCAGASARTGRGSTSSHASLGSAAVHGHGAKQRRPILRQQGQ